MGGLLDWLPEQLKTAGPVAVIAVVAVIAMWQKMWRNQAADRKTIQGLQAEIIRMAKDGTRASVANAKALEKLIAERRNRR